MSRLCGLCLLLLAFPLICHSTTAHNLGSRLSIDGLVSDFEPDEWILDATTVFPEVSGDSRWGRDNDIQRMALTWDDSYLYVGIPAATMSSRLMLFLDTGCGGLGSLQNQLILRRNMELGTMRVNLLLEVHGVSSDPVAGYIDCRTAFELVDVDRIRSRFVQDPALGGAFEAAIPWDLLGEFESQDGGTAVPTRGLALGVLAVVTGGPGTGAGDAAPNPTTPLENDSTRLAILDNHMVIPLDQNSDGMLDVGVSPRSIAGPVVMQVTSESQALPLRLIVEKKIIAPESGEVLRFLPLLDPDDFDQPVYLNAGIYSAAGRLLRRLYRDEARFLSGGGVPVWDTWDGRDDAGNVVPGGIYILVVSGGPAPGSPTKSVKAPLAVIR